MTTIETIETITDEQIESLQHEAATAGDEMTVHCCRIALETLEPGVGASWPTSVDEARAACVSLLTDLD